MRAQADDYKCWDDVERVTLDSATRTNPHSCSVTHAMRDQLRGSQRSPSGGVYTGYESTWVIPQALLPEGWEIKPRDAIVDARGTRHTVLTADHDASAWTWQCGTVDLVLALDLRDIISIERATLVYDTSGAPSKEVWQVRYSGLAARVQDDSADIADERGLRYGKRRFSVIVGRQVPAVEVAEDRVAWNDNGTTRYLDILRIRQTEQIEQLPVLECELRL